MKTREFASIRNKPGRLSLPIVLSFLLPGCAGIILSFLLPGCAGGSTEPQVTVLQVAGTYTTAVTLSDNTCGSGITVQPMNTVVSHTAGATSLILQHGPLTYTGTVTTTGAFTTQPNTVQQSGVQSTLTIVGQFDKNGFAAIVTVNVVQTQAPTTCSYKVNWAGTKQGAANTFP